jgi:Na+/proline symporter
MLAAVFAAIMSTTSSLLLQGSAELVRNVLQKGLMIRSGHDDVWYRNLGRLITLGFGLVALGLALAKVDTVFYLTLLAWSGLAASFGPTLFAACYWKKVTGAGILAGIITGTLVTFIWYNGGHRILGLHECLPSFVIASLALILVSRMTYREGSPS